MGAKEHARRNKCDVRFSHIRTVLVLQVNNMRTGVRKLVRTSLVPARAWGGQGVELRPQRGST